MRCCYSCRELCGVGGAAGVGTEIVWCWGELLEFVLKGLMMMMMIIIIIIIIIRTYIPTYVYYIHT